jgi:hypothetical protein
MDIWVKEKVYLLVLLKVTCLMDWEEYREPNDCRNNQVRVLFYT